MSYNVSNVEPVFFRNNNHHQYHHYKPSQQQQQQQINVISSSPTFNFDNYVSQRLTPTLVNSNSNHHYHSSHHNNLNNHHHQVIGVYDEIIPSASSFFHQQQQQNNVSSNNNTNNNNSSSRQTPTFNQYGTHSIKRNQSFNVRNVHNGAGDNFKSAYLGGSNNGTSLANSTNFIFGNRNFNSNSNSNNNGFRESPDNSGLYGIDLINQLQHQQQQYLVAKYFGGGKSKPNSGAETIGSSFGRHFVNQSPINLQQQQHQQLIGTNPSPTKMVQGGQQAPPAFFQTGYNIRFAVNGLSKFTRGGSMLPINRNIQAGDFGDDAGMIAENSRCIVIGTTRKKII